MSLSSKIALLSKAADGCSEGRQVLIRVDGHPFGIRKLAFEQGRDLAVSADLESGERLYFDPEQLSCVTVGAKVWS